MRWVAMVGVPMRILRNLGILKIILSLPILSDQKIEGPSDVKRMTKHINKNGSVRMIMAITAKVRSNKRFIKLTLNIAFRNFSTVLLDLIKSNKEYSTIDDYDMND